MMVDYVREMTVKKSCKYGQYGSFVHLLFLFFSGCQCKCHICFVVGLPAEGKRIPQ